MPVYSFPGSSPLKKPTPRRGAAQSRSGSSSSGKQRRKPRLLLIFSGLILAGVLMVGLLACQDQTAENEQQTRFPTLLAGGGGARSGLRCAATRSGFFQWRTAGK